MEVKRVNGKKGQLGKAKDGICYGKAGQDYFVEKSFEKLEKEWLEIQCK